MLSGGGEGAGEFTPLKLFSNVFISFVGAGVLGLPFAYREAGLLEGTVTMITVSAICIRAMLLLVECKNYRLANGSAQKGRASRDADLDYGDLARIALGQRGWILVQVAIVMSQLGFCCAYLIFISRNLQSLLGPLSQITYLSGLSIPLIALVMIRDLKGLSIFSLLADMANVLAYAVVFFFDFESMQKHGEHAKAIKFNGLIFFVGVCVYCFEGAGMVLSLENSVPKNRRADFPYLFSLALAIITTLYVTFGALGYASFGEDTQSIITLNLPPGLFPDFIKACLCFSLYFTYPVMLFPVSVIIDRIIAAQGRERPTLAKGNVLRASLVLASVIIVLAIPDFASIMGLIGSTCCMLLALIMPGLLHLRIMGKALTPAQRAFDYGIVLMGTFFLVSGTLDALARILSVHSEGNVEV